MSGVFQAVMRELGVAHFKSSIFHPQSQGALERHHQTLKTMIRAYCIGQAEEWDKSIPFLLFAIRDSVCESTGFSPFELVYGHEVRGPLKFVKEKFLAESSEENVLDYVSEFKERLRSACPVAKSHLQSAQKKMIDRFDCRAVTRSFNVGDKVLVLLPVRGEPLHARFSGPYTIKEKLSGVNYVVHTPDRRKPTRFCHVNLLKKYHERGTIPVVSVSVDEGEEADPSEMAPMEARLSNSVVLSDLDRFFGHLLPEQAADIVSLVNQFSRIFSDAPGVTSVLVHDIDVGDAVPVKQHPYRVNPHRLSLIRQEVHARA